MISSRQRLSYFFAEMDISPCSLKMPVSKMPFQLQYLIPGDCHLLEIISFRGIFHTKHPKGTSRFGTFQLKGVCLSVFCAIQVYV
jgi:hypothetical protein